MTIAERFITILAFVSAVPLWLVAAMAWHDFVADVKHARNAASSLMVALVWTGGLCVPAAWIVAWWLA